MSSDTKHSSKPHKLKGISPDLIQQSRLICKKYGTSYYLASKFLTKDQQVATWIFYTFVRLPDEIVDNSENVLDAQKKLIDWAESWDKQWLVYKNSPKSATLQDFDAEVILQTYNIFKKYNIPKKYGDEFLQAMKQDLTKARYKNYTELKDYMYGSAAVVGLVMSHIIGFKKNALVYAEKLGYAMQLTNFIRDIGEDWNIRKRIYMPQDELKKFGIDNTWIKNAINDARWKEFLKYQIQRADKLFEDAKPGYILLNKSGRLGVVTAAKLYNNILREVEINDYNVFTKRAKSGKLVKIKLVTQSICQTIKK